MAPSSRESCGHLHPIVANLPHNGQVNLVTSRLGRARAAAVLATLAIGAYLVWFAWDQPVSPQGFDSPALHSGWQVVGAALTLVVLAAAATWLGQGRMALLVLPLMFTSAATVDALPDAWLWPLNTLGTALGSALVVLVAYVNVQTLKRGRQHAQVHSAS